MEEESKEEVSTPEVQYCSCCGRTDQMIDILDKYFGRSITLHQVGLFEDPLCTECIKELHEIVFEQIYYGDPRSRAKEVQDKCIAILMNRIRPEIQKDEDLCDMLLYFEERINELRQKKFTQDSIRQYFHDAVDDWNQYHKHKCGIQIESSPNHPNQVTLYVRLLIDGCKSEGFSATIVFGPTNGLTSFNNDFTIPFKIE